MVSTLKDKLDFPEYGGQKFYAKHMSYNIEVVMENGKVTTSVQTN